MSMSLEYEPPSEPLHISVKQLKKEHAWRASWRKEVVNLVPFFTNEVDPCAHPHTKV